MEGKLVEKIKYNSVTDLIIVDQKLTEKKKQKVMTVIEIMNLIGLIIFGLPSFYFAFYWIQIYIYFKLYKRYLRKHG